MLAREAYRRPSMLAELHQLLYPGNTMTPSSEELLDRMARSAARALPRGDRLSTIARHMLGRLHGGEPGAREYRRTLSEGSRIPEPGPRLFAPQCPPIHPPLATLLRTPWLRQ
jgi:tRNA-dihydrouridine synthase A